jgi:hypothetical protein
MHTIFVEVRRRRHHCYGRFGLRLDHMHPHGSQPQGRRLDARSMPTPECRWLLLLDPPGATTSPGARTCTNESSRRRAMLFSGLQIGRL